MVLLFLLHIVITLLPLKAKKKKTLTIGQGAF